MTQAIGNLRSLIAALLEDFAGLVESSLTKLVTVSLLNIRKNLELADCADLSSIAIKFDMHALISVGNDDNSRLAMACGSLTMLANLAHTTPQRSDLMRLIESTLAALLIKLSTSSNRLLIVHTLHLYMRHLADIFVATQTDFSSAVSVVCQFVAAGCTSEDSPSFAVSVGILERYFDIFKEQSSDALNVYLIDVAPKIFAILLSGVDRAVDVRYFGCIEKYVKIFGSRLSAISTDDLMVVFDKMADRLIKEIKSFKADDCKFLDVEDYCTLQSTAQIIAELFVATRKHAGRVAGVIESIMSSLVDLLTDNRYSVDTAFSDVVIGMLKVHMASIQSSLR